MSVALPAAKLDDGGDTASNSVAEMTVTFVDCTPLNRTVGAREMKLDSPVTSILTVVPPLTDPADGETLSMVAAFCCEIALAVTSERLREAVRIPRAVKKTFRKRRLDVTTDCSPYSAADAHLDRDYKQSV
jgi:hypothetical protein